MDLPLSSRDTQKSVGDFPLIMVGNAAEAERKDLGTESKKWLKTSLPGYIVIKAAAAGKPKPIGLCFFPFFSIYKDRVYFS